MLQHQKVCKFGVVLYKMYDSLFTKPVKFFDNYLQVQNKKAPSISTWGFLGSSHEWMICRYRDIRRRCGLQLTQQSAARVARHG